MFYRMINSGLEKYHYISDNLSFIKYTKEVCGDCGRNISRPVYDGREKSQLLIDEGSVYPDWLQYCGGGKHLLILSDKALSAIKTANISGISPYYEIEIVRADVDGNIIVDKSAPLYYNLKIDGSIDFDYKSMLLKKKNKCKSCGQYELNRKRLKPYILDKNTWDGSDICSLQTFPANWFCTEKLVDLAKTEKLTGFDFEPVKCI